MSTPPSNSMSVHTSSSSTLGQLIDLGQPSASLDQSEEATACSTFSENKKEKLDPAQDLKQLLGKKPFRRLPIADSLFTPPLKRAQDGDEASQAAVQSQFGSDLPDFNVKVRSEEDTFPQSPGNTPFSRFSPSPELKSPSAVFARLLFGFQPKEKRSRNRSYSDVISGRKLHPSPPPAPRGGIQLEPEDLLVPRKKVAKRKPIPPSLFASSGGREEIESRSFSVPDIFSQIHDQGETSQSIQAGNCLGLFFPSTTDLLATVEASVVDPSISPSVEFTRDSADLSSVVVSPTTQRLRRSTRSISESHNHRHRPSLSVRANSDLSSAQSRNDGAKVSFPTPSCRSLGLSDWSNSDSSGEEQTHRGRTRSGSEPIYHSPSAFVEAERRYSIDQQSHPLRRVSRKKQGEMRSVYLSRTSQPFSGSTPARTHSLDSQRHLQPLSQNVAAVGDQETIEVLKTPDVETQATFERPPATMSFSSFPSPSKINATDSLHSTGSASWDYGSLSPSSGSANGMSTASLMILQQHIQMRNYIRESAPPVADPHSSKDTGATRREEKGSRVAQRRNGSQPKASGEVQGEGEDRMSRQYGAMRMKKSPSSEFGDDGQERRSSVSRDQSSDESSEGREEQGGARVVGLRTMFSHPILTASSKEADAGSLRQRRAKPPISIALAPSSHRSRSNSSSKPPTEALAPGNPLRKKPSRSHILSPTASIHSPPPCPPPATPLPDLPIPHSAPIAAASTSGAAAGKKALGTKRSFIRSSSTPASPLDADAPARQAQQRSQRGAPKSQSVNLISSFTASVSGTSRDGGDGWNEGSTADSSMLHTPPLTGGLPLSMPPSDQQKQYGQHREHPITPLSALTESSIATPLTAQPTAAGVVGGKFESLLAYLSSKSRSGGETNDEANKENRRTVKDAAEGERMTMASNSAAPGDVVYGLAL